VNLNVNVNPDLHGTWISTSAANALIKTLVFGPGTCTIDGAPGQWAVKGAEIWLMQRQSRSGRKWILTVEGNDTLVLSCPEDFNYLGGNEYFYFQMTPPGTVVTLARVARESG
jgi:hypothetical protein